MRTSQERRLPTWAIGLIVLLVIVTGALIAFSSLLGLNLRMPWSETYEVKAVFSSAQGVRETAPVRIAGVAVGEVTSVEPMLSEASDLEAQSESPPASEGEVETPGEQAAVVTMELTEDARPIREDAQFKLRPRLFLEGNLFVDVEPGSPNAEEVETGHTFPVNQTAYSVQLDQIFTTLQGDVRRDLQIFLNQFGNALIKHGGAEGFQELYRSSPAANKFTSQVNEALLGTEKGDLGNLIKGLDRVVRALGQNELALKSLIGNFRTFTGSFAAEDAALGRAIEELPGVLDAAEPAFANLNAAFPSLRAFSREALPGVRSTPATLEAAIPFLEQVRALVSERELRGLVADLRPTIPKLAKLVATNTVFLKQARRLSSCFNEVVIPWGNDTVDPPAEYPFEPFGRVFETTGYGLAGIAGESRSGDGNGQYIRTQAGGGANTVIQPPGPGRPDTFYGLTPFPITGSVPAFNPVEDSAKTPFKPQRPCERQEPPDLGATLGIAPEQESSATASMPAGLQSLYDRYTTLTTELGELQAAEGSEESSGSGAEERRITRQIAELEGELEDQVGAGGAALDASSEVGG
jgi:ABC-type transporter Mla subunit MlaD